jgi:hypothetical protein
MFDEEDGLPWTEQTNPPTTEIFAGKWAADHYNSHCLDDAGSI